MKQIYMKSLLIVSLTLVSVVQAQTYTINSSGGGTCPHSGIGAAHSRGVWSTATAAPLGSFTDTNSSNVELTRLQVFVYGVNAGTAEVFLNSVSLGNVNTTSFATCPAISTVKFGVVFTLSTAIKNAYNLGGSNTISVRRVSGAPDLYFYGAEVVATTQVLGVEDSEYALLEVYPNPAREFLIVTGLKSAKRFNVYDILGKNVLNGAVSNHQTIDVRGLQKGLYFLRFPDGGYSTKFIKQ